MCLAVLRSHRQGRHEARQSYGLELPSLAPPARHPAGPTMPKAKAKEKGEIRMVGGAKMNAAFIEPPNIPLPMAPGSGAGVPSDLATELEHPQLVL